MQLSGRPLLDNLQDHRLFVGRDDALGKLHRSLRSGWNCLVFGEPGSGKTSLVRALMFRSELSRTEEGAPKGRQTDHPSQFDFVYLRANEARSAVELLTAILDVMRPGHRVLGTDQLSPMALLDELKAAVLDRRDRAAAIELADVSGNHADGDGALAGDIAREGGEVEIDDVGGDTAGKARSGSGQPRTQVIVVEDVSAIAGAEVFGALRDELWEVDALWLVTMSTTQVSGLLRPPADVFFETTVQLGPLTKEEARELLRRRLDEPDSRASKELISIAADIAVATPRRLLEVARELGAEPAVGGSRLNTGRGLKAREAAVARLTRPARMLAHELEAIGWASASDERLLSRMGWTRPRVIQVIAELQSGGLVQMREENTGRGRPRKLYRLTPASDFIDPISEPRAGGPS